jgi:anti-anti-sigma factor
MDLRWPLRIAEQRRDGVLVLTLTGRLGAASAAPFAANLTQFIEQGHVRMVLDLAGVDYISSAGLNAVRAAAALCVSHHGALALCGLTDPVRIALDLGGLLAELDVAPSREGAIVKAAAAP